MQALYRLRNCGQKSVTVKDLVTEIYGSALDETTKTLALEPFVDEVLRKLAGDGRVGFQMRGGQRKWYSLEAAQEQHITTPGLWSSETKAPSVITTF